MKAQSAFAWAWCLGAVLGASSTAAQPFSAPNGTAVTWCYTGWGAGSGRQPETSGCVVRLLDASAAFNGQNPELRYCAPQHDCLKAFNGAYIQQGDLEGEGGSASTAIAADALASQYGGAAKVPVQAQWDWVITHCPGVQANSCAGSGVPPGGVQCSKPKVCIDPPVPVVCPTCPPPPVLVAIPADVAQTLKDMQGWLIIGPGRKGRLKRVADFFQGVVGVKEAQ